MILQTLQMIIRHIFLLKMWKNERASVSLFIWFENNLLKGNADKFHSLVSPSQEVSLNVNNFEIKNSDWEKLLGVKFYYKLRFDQHITDLCRRTSRKIHALARVTPFMNLSRRRLLMDSFFKTQLITVHWFGCVIVMKTIGK